jgi:hypothetical protein
MSTMQSTPAASQAVLASKEFFFFLKMLVKELDHENAGVDIYQSQHYRAHVRFKASCLFTIT